MKYIDRWLEFYLEGTKFAKVLIPFPHNFSQNHNTFYFQFTFNQQINFKGFN